MQVIKNRLPVLFSAFMMSMALVLTSFSGNAQAQFRSFDGSGGGGSATAGPNLTAVVESIEGGELTVGSTSYIVVLFRNDGVSPVEVGEINLYPSSTVSANVSLNQCAREPLPPGADCAITIAASGLQVGSYRIEMLIDHNGRTRLATASVSGTVEGLENQEQTAQSELEAFPEALDFGSVSSGIEQIRSITFRNKTPQEIKIDEIYLEAAPKSGYSYKTNCENLKAGAACIATVTWSPTIRGPSLGSLVIKHDGVTGISRVDVSGDYAPDTPADAPIYPDTVPNSGLLITDKSEFDFESGIESVSAITASLVNVGDQDLIIQDIRLSSSDNGLSVGRNGCDRGRVLAPNAACPLTITWAPSRTGPLLDDVQIRHTGARGILVIPVRGEADAAVSRDSISVRTMDGEIQDDVPINLDGYIVTSLSPRTAVISGPIGTIVVKDGQETVIAGVPWQVDIKSTGVDLMNGNNSILLVFDRSLTPTRINNTTNDSSSSSNNNNSNNNASSSSDDDN